MWLAVSVALVCAASLVALRWTLAHREKKFTHEPIADMQRKLDELESRLLNRALNGR